MPVEYRIDILNAAGAKLAEVGGGGRAAFLALTCAKHVNAPAMATFSLNYAHAAVSLMSDKNQIQIWRRWPDQGIPWYTFFSGFYRDDVIAYHDGREVITFDCPGDKTILSWQLNAYNSAYANKTTWTAKPVETIMKNLITNNFTTAGTTGAGRDRNATSGGAVNGCTITVEADSARGTVVDYATTRSVVLTDLQDLVNAAGTGDFDLVKTGPATWQFRYYPLLGTDRAATVTFSTAFGNMRNPQLTRTRSEERTAIIVGGGGVAGSRSKVTRTGVNYNVATNAIEDFADGASTTGGTTNTATLNAVGDKHATRKRWRALLSYDIAQVSASMLDKHYFMGDKVAAYAFGLTFVQQVVGITMSMKGDGQGETLTVEMRDY